MDPIKGYFEERGGLLKMITDFFGIEDPDGLKQFVKGKAKDVLNNVKNDLKSAGKWAWNNSPIKPYVGRYKARKSRQRIEHAHNAGYAPVAATSYSDFENQVVPEEEDYGWLEAQYDQEDLESGEGSRLRKMFARGSRLRRFRGGATAQEVDRKSVV